MRGKTRSGTKVLKLTLNGAGSPSPIELTYSRKQRTVIAASFDELNDAIGEVVGRKRIGVRIDFCEGSHVARHLAPYCLPKSRLQKMAEMDVRASTPFDLENIHLLFPGGRNRKEVAQYFIVKRDQVAPIIEVLKRRGLALEDVVFQTDGDAVSAGKEGARLLAGSHWRDSLRRWIGLVCVFLVIAGSIGLYKMADQKLDTALNTLNSEIASVQKVAAAARKSYERQTTLHAQQAALRQEKTAANATVTIWEEISRIVPDNTWLADMTIKDGTITLSGFSSSAADIIPILEGSGKFEDPRFISSVNRVPGREFEKFTLQMRVRPPEAAS